MRPPPPPRGVCFLLCVRLPVINDCSASLTDAATTKNASKKDKKEKTNLTENGGKPKATSCTRELELELELGLIVLEN